MKNKKCIKQFKNSRGKTYLEVSKVDTLYNVSSEFFTKQQENINIVITKQ